MRFRRRHLLIATTIVAEFVVCSPALPEDVGGRVARGRYLVNGVGQCFGCHSPLEKGELETPVKGRLGAGDIISEKERTVAPNITPDPTTGAGLWTDRELSRAIREGVGHDGRRLSLGMPYNYFSVMTDDDVGSVVAYLRSLPAVQNRLPKWTPVDAGEAAPEPLRAPATAAELARPVDRGAYLVRIARCGFCHTPRPASGSRRHRLTLLEFGGGRRFSRAPFYDQIDPDPWLSGPAAGPGAANDVLVSANITSHPSGISYYDEGIFIQTIRTGRVAGIRPLSGAMPWNYFRTLTDEDLRAIFLYLRSVPPVPHRVNNSDPLTWCIRCGRFHGLGELNSGPPSGR
jgi:mono/diheme cytochrome c family protein